MLSWSDALSWVYHWFQSQLCSWNESLFTNVSLCYSKPLIPVYKSMSDRDMICSLRRNKLNKMGKTVFQNQKVRELSRILDKQEVVVDDLVSSWSMKSFSERSRNFGPDFQCNESTFGKIASRFPQGNLNRRRLQVLSRLLSFLDAHWLHNERWCRSSLEGALNLESTLFLLGSLEFFCRDLLWIPLLSTQLKLSVLLWSRPY